MRLLRVRDLELTEFGDEETMPEYAALSHTWEEQEVSFADLQHRDGLTKVGHRNIKLCAEQAIQMGSNTCG